MDESARQQQVDAFFSGGDAPSSGAPSARAMQVDKFFNAALPTPAPALPAPAATPAPAAADGMSLGQRFAAAHDLSTFGAGPGIGAAIERGLVTGPTSMAKGLVLMPAAGAATLLDKAASLAMGRPVTPLGDFVFKHLVAPADALTRHMDALGANATLPEKVATNVASFVGQAPALMAGLESRAAELGTEGLVRAVPLAEQTLPQLFMRGTQEAATHAIAPALTMAIPAASQGAEQAYDATGSPLAATNAALSNIAKTYGQMVMPLSMPGGLLPRALTGGATGALTGQMFNPQATGADAISNALIGGITGAVAGPRPIEMPQVAAREALGAANPEPDVAHITPKARDLTPAQAARRADLVQAHSAAITPDQRAQAAQDIAAFDIAHTLRTAAVAPAAAAEAAATAPEVAAAAKAPEPSNVTPLMVPAHVLAMRNALEAQQARQEALQGAHEAATQAAPEAAPSADLQQLQSEFLGRMRDEIGWEEQGGRILRQRAGWEAEGEPNAGDVVGRTPWVAKANPFGELSDFWRNRPDARLTAAQAQDALEKAATPEALNAPQRRFVAYAQQTARDYAVRYQNEQAQHDAHLADLSAERRAQELDQLREQGEPIAPADEHEALTLEQWVDHAHAAGVAPRDILDASDAPTLNQQAARLSALIHQQEANAHATDTAAAPQYRAGALENDPGRNGEPVGPDRNQALQASGRSGPLDDAGNGRAAIREPTDDSGAQDVPRQAAAAQASLIPQSDLFAVPTQREQMDAEARRRDALRNGTATAGRKDMGAGPGDLFAGARPVQGELGNATASFTAAKPLAAAHGSSTKVDAGAMDVFFPEQRGDASDGAARAIRKDTLGALSGAKGLRQRVRLVRTGEFSSGIARVRDVADAAHIIAPLRKSPQEQLLLLVVDKDGAPLAVVRHSIGSINASSAVPGLMASTVAAVPGARGVYFAHNHPSGRLEASSADRAVGMAFNNLLRGSGIELRGSLIVAPGSKKFVQFGGESDINSLPNVQDISTAARGVQAVPRMERQFSKVSRAPGEYSDVPLPTESLNPRNAKGAVANVIDSGTRSGILLLDTQHKPIGVYPMSTESMARLRTGDVQTSMVPVLRALHESNAAAAIVFGDDPLELSSMRNLGSALTDADVRVLDLMYRTGTGTDAASSIIRSVAESNQHLQRVDQTPFLSAKEGETHGSQVPPETPRARAPAAETQHSRTLSAALDRMLARGGSQDHVQLHEVAREHLPQEQRDAMDAFDRATGTRTVVVRNLTPHVFDFNGASLRDGRIFVNENNEHPLVNVMGHEFTHQLRVDQPALYSALESEARKGDLGAYARERLGGVAGAHALAPEELTADAVGDAVSDPAFMARLADANPGVFKRVAMAFKAYLDATLAKMRGLKDLASNRYLQDVEQFRSTLLNVMQGYRPTRTAQAAAETPVSPFQRWFGASKAVDAQGNPLTVYHGTASDHTTFDDARLGTNTGHMTAPLGHFFTEKRANAQAYAEKAADYLPAYARVVDAHLAIQNPKEMHLQDLMAIDSHDEARALRNRLQAQGYDGIHLPDIQQWVAFKGHQIKSASENQGTFDANNPDIRFSQDNNRISGMANADAPLLSRKQDERDLIAQHNTTAEKLLHADRMGGLATPSLAITRADHPVDSFGDVTLLGDKTMATPSSRMRVFGSDVYSTRYPAVQHKLTSDAVASLNRTLAPFRDPGDGAFTGANGADAVEALTSYAPFVRSAEQGAGRALTYAQLKDAAGELLRQSGAQERIFKGFNDNGDRRYAPHTLDNVVRIMRQGIRGGEDFNYGAGSLRARVTPEFKSLRAVRSAKGALVDQQTFEPLRDEVNQELLRVASAIGGPRVPDTALSILEDAPRMGIDAAAKQFGVTLTPDARQQALDFIDKLKALPTAYFEAKALRAVGIHEFKAAVVPSDLADNARAVLQKHGVPTFEYTRGDQQGRAQAIQTAAASAPDLMFSRKSEPDDGMAAPTDLAGDTREGVARIAAQEARRLAEANRTAVLGSLAARGYTLGAQGWNADSGKWEGVAGSVNQARIRLQDKMLPMREAQKDIEKQLGASLPDAVNVYIGENLMHGAAGDAMRGLEHDIIKPIARRMRNLGLSSAQMQDFLVARHTAERNARIAEINPAMPDGGIGMTNAQAAAVLAGEKPGPYSGKVMDAATRAKIEQVAPLFDKLRSFTLDTLEHSGQISQQQARTLRGMYQHYAPARGQRADDDAAFMGEQQGPGTGRGLSAMRVGIKRALGRGEGNLPQNVIGEMIGDAQRSILGASKASVGRQLLRLALAHPNPNFWQVEPVDMEWKFSQQTGEAYLAPKSGAEDAHRTMLVNEGGNFYRVRFHNPEVAEAMLNLGPRDLNAMARVLGPTMRYLSATMTTYNPAFLPVNMTRDLGLGLSKVVADHGVKVGAQVLAKWPSAIRAMWGDYVHRAGDADAAQETQALRDRAREFARAGGMTDIAVVPDVETLGKQMDHAILNWREALATGHPLVAAGKVVMPLAHVVERANVAVENGIRLAAYSALRDNGVSIPKAAAYAKDLTVNFNRKGRWGSVLNSLYLFYNASVQGAHTVGKMVKDHPVGIGSMLGSLAALQATMALSMMQDKGKDGVSTWDTIPDYRKMTSMIIPAPWSKDGYVSIPLAYGFNWFAYAGGRLAQHFSGNDVPGTNPISDMAGAGMRSFSPFPLDQGVQGALPFMFAKVVQLASNQTDYGSPIARDSGYTKFATPKAAQGRVDTPTIYKTLAWGLNRLGGGDDFTPPQYLSSLTDVAPEDLEWMIETALGGIGGTASRGVRAAQGLQAGVYKDLPSALTAIPVANAFGFEGNRNAAIGMRARATEDDYQRGLARLRAAYAAGGPQAFADERAKLGPMFNDVAPAAYQSGARAGEAHLNAAGLPTLSAPQGTFFQADRLAGKQLRAIGQAIVQLRADTPISTGTVLRFYAGPSSLKDAAAALHVNANTPLTAAAPATLRRQVLQAMMDRRAQVQDMQLQRARGN